MLLSHMELLRLLVALAAGGAIGMERTLRGRAAGFRTHALVCLASSLLMQIETGDPTRLAQGVVTGVGFLGAGVIFKEGATVRGLTTAASVWITSVIGILAGLGRFGPSVVAALLAVLILTVFQQIETRMPAHFYAELTVRFGRGSVMSEDRLRSLLAEHGCAFYGLSYSLTQDGKCFEYSTVIRASDEKQATRLAQTFGALESVREFSLSPTIV